MGLAVVDWHPVRPDGFNSHPWAGCPRVGMALRFNQQNISPMENIIRHWQADDTDSLSFLAFSMEKSDLQFHPSFANHGGLSMDWDSSV